MARRVKRVSEKRMGGNCFNNNAQGGQSRVNPTPVNSAESNYASAARTIPNGTNVQPQYHGGSDVPVANANAKSSESSAAQWSTRIVPKAPASQPPSVSSDSASPTTPAKGDASKAFPFQFGSISPGFMNGMAGLHDFSRPASSVPTPPVPKQQPANKDTGVADLSKAGDTHTKTRAKKDPLVSPLPPASQMQKPSGGILSGPMQSMVNQGGMQRNSPDGERWQRAASFQHRGLILSPNQSPLQMMHKAEKKYEVGKVADEEQAKQWQLKGILDKLTPQNFKKLFAQVKAVNIDNAVTLTGVILQIFEKALMEPTYCEMYANLCFHLAAALPDLSLDNEKITFKRLLLNKCQEEFERGEREQEEANKADEGEVKQTDEEREEKRRRKLGNIRLIGELYKKKMLTERIMHGCIMKLLGQYQDPDEEDIESLCKLMSTIGEMIDHPKAKEHMDAYFERMRSLSNNMNLSSMVRFMLKDVIDLRKNKWQQRRKVEGPKKIEEVHIDTSQERQAQAGRLGRGPGNIGERRVPIPLPQRPLGDDSITLGPQGGLAKGMSIIGPPAVSSSTGINGYSNLPDHASYSSRKDPSPRYVSDRFAGPTAYDQSNVQEHNMNYGNKDLRNSDRILDSPVVTSPPARAQGTAGSQNTSSEGGWSEEKLQNMSMAAIREYYRQLCYMENENEAVADDVVEIIATKKDIWPQNVESHFIALLEEEVKKGNRQTTTLTKAAWKHIKEDLKTKFGKEYTMKQFKNKYNQLRGKWIDFTNLIKMETGLGYNSTMGQIIASDDEWKKLCEKYKPANLFKKKGCFHYDKLCIIFGDTTASGANQHPSTKSPSISNDDSEGEKTMKKMNTNQVVGLSSNATGEVDGQDNEANNKLMTCLSILDKLEGIGAAPFTKVVKMLKKDPLWRDIFLASSDERKKDIVLNL